MSRDVSVTGVKELDAAFNTWKRAVQGQFARKAMRAGGKVIVKKAKQLAPDRKRRNVDRKLVKGLKRSITQRVKTYRHTGVTLAVVGPSWPEGAHGHLVEYGHRNVTADGRSVGFTQPHPFMRPAADTSRAAVRSAIVTSYRVSMKTKRIREINKLNG